MLHLTVRLPTYTCSYKYDIRAVIHAKRGGNEGYLNYDFSTVAFVSQATCRLLTCITLDSNVQTLYLLTCVLQTASQDCWGLKKTHFIISQSNVWQISGTLYYTLLIWLLKVHTNMDVVVPKKESSYITYIGWLIWNGLRGNFSSYPGKQLDKVWSTFYLSQTWRDESEHIVIHMMKSARAQAARLEGWMPISLVIY